MILLLVLLVLLIFLFARHGTTSSGADWKGVVAAEYAERRKLV